MRNSTKQRWLALSLGIVWFVLVGSLQATPPAVEPPNHDQEELTNDTWRHLKIAADHLRSAGRKELAKTILAEAEELRMQQALADKLTELAAVREEVRELQADLGVGEVIVLRMQLVECSLNDQLASGLEIMEQIARRGGLASEKDPANLFRCLDSDDAVKSVLKELKDHGALKILCAPTLATVSGRAASLHTGGLHPIVVPQGTGLPAVEFCEMGTRVDVMPVVHPDGSLRLELRLSVREVDETLPIMIGDKQMAGVRARLIDTALEMKMGQTAVLLAASSSSERQKGETTDDATVLLMTVTAEFGDSVQQAKQSATETR